MRLEECGILYAVAISVVFEKYQKLFSTPDLYQGPKKIRDPGFAESKVWDLDGHWTLRCLFCCGTLET